MTTEQMQHIAIGGKEKKKVSSEYGLKYKGDDILDYSFPNPDELVMAKVQQDTMKQTRKKNFEDAKKIDVKTKDYDKLMNLTSNTLQGAHWLYLTLSGNAELKT